MLVHLIDLGFYDFPEMHLTLQIVALDVNLPVKQAFHILYEQVCDNLIFLFNYFVLSAKVFLKCSIQKYEVFK